MKTYIIIILAALILTFLISNSKVRISIKLIKDGKNDEVIVKIAGLLGILKYKKEYPLLGISKDKEGLNFNAVEKTSNQNDLVDEDKHEFDYEDILMVFNEYKKAFNYIRKKSKIEEFISHLYFSSENVFSSIMGFNVINVIHKYIYDNIDTDNMSLEVIPGFNENALRINFNTSFYLKLRNFLYLAKYYRLFKIKQGGAYNE